MGKQFTMTQEDYDDLLDQMKPPPVMYLSGGTPMFSSQQERANSAWEKLGKKMGFRHMTVRPIGNNPLVFTAEPSADPSLVKKEDAP